MKTLSILCSILLLTGFALALPPVYTTVTATVVDSSGQHWMGGTWSTTFVPTPGKPQSSFNNNGVSISNPQQGLMDGTGAFTVSLDNNNVVAPAGSQWQFIICPNASSPCSTINITISGLSQDISAILTAQIMVPFVNAQPNIQRAYSDAEANGGYGSLYVNTTDNTLRQCTNIICSGTGWSLITIPSSNPVFTGTLTTGCVKFKANSSDSVTVCPQVGSGNVNVNLATLGGTIPTTATSPIVINSTTGVISCPTCGGVGFPLQAPNGTVGAPSYSWSASTNSGFFRFTSSLPHGSEDQCYAINGFCTLEIFNGGTFSNGTLGSTGDITTNNAINAGTGNLTTGNIFSLSVTGTTSISPVLNLSSTIHSTSSSYLADGKEVTTPGTPAATTQRGYFKAGRGFCAIDSGAVEYCTSSGNANAAVLAISTTTGLTNTTFGNSNTTIITHAVTMPNAGCPCRVQANWWLYLSVTNSGQDVAYVSDGTAGFAGAETATTGAATGYGFNSSGFSTITYANNAVVTFNLIAAGSHAGSTTVSTTQLGTAITGAPASSLVLTVMASN